MLENINKLKNLANQQTSPEQYVSIDGLRDWSTAEIYTTGVEDGKIMLARQILETLGVSY